MDAHILECRRRDQYLACVCDLLSLVLIVKGELDLSFAEAIASHVARGFVSIVGMRKHLDELHITSDHVMDLQKLVDYFCLAAKNSFGWRILICLNSRFNGKECYLRSNIFRRI
jgi:hypothetical protein